MDREELESFSRPANQIYLKMEEELLKNVAKRIGRGNSLLLDIERLGDVQRIRSWEADRLKDLGALNQENIRTISKYSGETIEKVEEMVMEAGIKSVNGIESDMRDGFEKGVLSNKPETPRKSPALMRIAETVADGAKDSYNLINTTMLDQSQSAYIDILSRTSNNVLAGTTSPQEALRQVSKEWAHKGVPALIDSAGREWSTEAYVSMVNRSMANTVANDMQDARMKEYGVDLVEISEHDGARPGCADYQGKIFSMSGNSDEYPALSDTSYGEAAGLFGVNCGHVKYPYIPGISTKRGGNIDEEKNKEVYEESQHQRKLERRIREAKREELMLMELGDGQGVHFAQEKVKERQAELRGFVKETGRTRRTGREQIR